MDRINKDSLKKIARLVGIPHGRPMVNGLLSRLIGTETGKST